VRTAVIAMTGLVDGIIVFTAEQTPKCGPHPMTRLATFIT
jgi:hypothetical protein